jgi:hypothetical protein
MVFGVGVGFGIRGNCFGLLIDDVSIVSSPHGVSNSQSYKSNSPA